jgi:hypothetical protein
MTAFGERYRVLGELERYGSMTTRLCFDEAFGVEVEVDDLELVAGLPDELIDRLRRLLDAALKIDSVHALSLREWCEEDGHIYVIRERAEGESLAHILSATGKLPAGQVAEIAGAVTEVLTEAYGKGIFYLGLNPGQLLVDGRGRARVVRAGYAWVMEELDPVLSARASAYRAPETDGSVEGARISDIYSLALIIKEMLPADCLSEKLRSLLERCLDPLPSHRPSSPRLILEELRASGDRVRPAADREFPEQIEHERDGAFPKEDSGAATMEGPAAFLKLKKERGRRPMRTLLFILLCGISAWLLFAAISAFTAGHDSAPPEIQPSEPETVTLPDLEGLRLDEARKTLEDMGLRVELREAASRLWSAGLVATQEPPRGSKLSTGDSVLLGVSSGSEQAADTARQTGGSPQSDGSPAEGSWSSSPAPAGPGNNSQSGSGPEKRQALSPKALCSASARRGPAPLYVALDAGSSYDPDGRIVRYVWDCGDGTVLEGARVQHVFDPAVIPAKFHVVLRVFDDQGLAASTSLTVEVF